LKSINEDKNKQKTYFYGAMLAVETIKYCKLKPRTVSELVDLMYGEDRKNTPSNIGRVFGCVEKLVESKVLVPKLNNGSLRFAFNNS